MVTLMYNAPETGRADIALMPDRVYYRFATDDSIEDGDLPGLKERYDSFASEIISTLETVTPETSIPADRLRVKLFVDNAARTFTLTPSKLTRLNEILTSIDPVFVFLQQL